MKRWIIFLSLFTSTLMFPWSIVLAEESITTSGAIQIIHADNFVQKTSKSSYSLKSDDGNTYQLSFLNGNPKLIEGTRVVVQGLKNQHVIAVNLSTMSSLTITQQAQTLPPILGEKKIAVILFNFSNNTSTPYSSSEIRDLTFIQPDSANGYYKEASSNQMSLVGKQNSQGDVYGWVTIPYTNQNCDEQYQTWMDSAKQILTQQGNDLSGYDAYIYLLPQTQSCSFTGGLAVGNNALINGTYNTYVVGHELGHIFGTGHANAYRCTDAKGYAVPIGQFCTELEYEDPFDIMAAITRHHNARTKRLFGWINNAATEAIEGTATVILKPQEFTPGGIQSFRIPKKVEYNTAGELVAAPPHSFYFLEYRQPWGLFDTFSPNEPVVRGVTIRVDSNKPDKDTQLIDTVPQTSLFVDAPLLSSRNFSDIPAGISVTTQSTSAQFATIQVSFTPPKIPSISIAMECVQEPHGLRVSWTNGPSGTTFIEKCLGQYCENFSAIGSTTRASFLDTQVATGSVYTYRVRTQTSQGEMSAYSYPQLAYFACTQPSPSPTLTPSPTPTPLPTITLQKVNICNQTMSSIEWNHIQQATHYEIWRCIDNSGTCTQFSNIATKQASLPRTYNQKLIQGESTVYRYKVRGLANGKVMTDFSNIQNLTYTVCGPGWGR